jgi:hypothetical protein
MVIQMFQLKKAFDVTVFVGALVMGGLFSANSYSAQLLSLEQGWDEHDRDFFYYVPQGAPILNYEWFLALEVAGSKELFRTDKNLSSFGLIPWAATPNNPDALPIGVTSDRSIYTPEKQMGINCSACHVTEVTVSGQTVLIDGGVSHFDLWTFMASLLDSLKETYADQEKLKRFSDRISTNVDELKPRLAQAIQHHENWHARNHANTPPGPGRADALNVILNQVTAQMIGRPDNARPADAPASYPYLWDAPYLDFVQYVGSVPNDSAGVLARNVGQVLGVFGEVSVLEGRFHKGYINSVRSKNLYDIEKKLETLKSPLWSELADRGVLPALNATLVSEGEKIYAKECESCHTVVDARGPRKLNSIAVKNSPVKEVKTDPGTAASFASRTAATGPLNGRKGSYLTGAPLCERTYANQLLAHMAVAVIVNDFGQETEQVGGLVKDVFGDLFTSAEDIIKQRLERSKRTGEESDALLIATMQKQGKSAKEIAAELEARDQNHAAVYELIAKNGSNYPGEDAACMEAVQVEQYRAKPLNGIWATGPFLHNGSVPTLADLLEPSAARPTKFTVGASEFDPIKIGFSENVSGINKMIVDTSLTGNSNAGHEYGVSLTPSQKKALLEYLKSL